MPQTLLRTKLRKPRLDCPSAPRAELIRRIDHNLQGDFTLIVAPAGYGKTTLAAQWASQAALPVAWLTLDEHDNELAQFLSYVVAAIQTIDARACANVRALLDRSPLPDVQRLAMALASAVENVAQRFVLVLDDYHYLEDPAISELLNEVLRHSSRQMHLLITSRSQPPLALAKLRSTRRLHELNTYDLRLTQAEAEVLLEKVWCSPCAPERATALLQQTEGWATGVYLAALAQQPETDSGRSIHSRHESQNPRTDEYTAQYLLEQVLQRQPPATRDFLLKTSILDRLTPSLVEAVAGDSQPISLQALAQAGLFLNRVDGSEEWYTYHSLFRSFLGHELASSSVRQHLPVLHRRASVWFCGQGHYDDALQHAFAAGDSTLALQIVVDHFAQWLERDQWRSIQRRLALFSPDLLDQHPWLLMARAHILVLQFKWNTILPLVQRAEQQLAGGAFPLSPSQERVLRSHLDVLWSVHWSWMTDASKATEAARRALQMIPDGHFYARGILQLSLTLSLQSNGEAAMAEQMLAAALAQAELSGAGSAALLRPLLCLLSCHFAEGDLASAAQIARLLLHKAVEARSAFNQQLAQLALGVAAYETDNLRGAVYHFQEGANLCQLGGVRAGHECLVGLALSFQALGQKDAVRRVMQQMSEFHAETGSSVLASEALSLQRRLGLAQGGLRAELRQRGVGARTSIWYGWLEIPAITQVRLALADGQPRSLAQADTALSALWAVAVELRKPVCQATLLSLKAILLMKQQRVAAAKAALSQALELGEERGLVRCIVDAGPQLEPLIEELSITRPSAYLERLRAAIGNPTVAGPVGENKQRAVRLEAPLTRREREVLALLGQYRTDREIAETLVISPLTVRTHIENLSSKLEVNGRRAIVSRAREHGLLA